MLGFLCCPGALRIGPSGLTLRRIGVPARWSRLVAERTLPVSGGRFARAATTNPRRLVVKTTEHSFCRELLEGLRRRRLACR